MSGPVFVPNRPARRTAFTAFVRQASCSAILAITALITCPAWAQHAPPAPTRPQRIVSTNYCTDQMLLRLVEPERIVSLTYLSWDKDATPPEFQPILDRTPRNHGLAEEVLMLEPDLVVGGAYSARFSNSLLQQLGRDLFLIQPENNFEDWYANVRRMGLAVGEPARADKLIADFRRELAAMQAEIPPGEMPIYADLQVNNWMPGKNTLYTAIVNAGGFRTAGETLGYSGYRGIPIEELIQIDAALISTNLNKDGPKSMTRESLKHPLLRRMADRAIAEINIPNRYVVCPTPELLKMIRQLVDMRKLVDSKRAAAKPVWTVAPK